jgi:hydrogenase maturation factor HypF (carbamoyltransferase family)
VHPSLRDFLKREVPPAQVWRAIEAALEGGSEAARVSASRLLVDALHESDEEADWRAQARSERQVAAERFMAQIERAVEIKANTGDVVDAEGRVLGTITRVELERLREIERRWLALPEHVRAEFSAL